MTRVNGLVRSWGGVLAGTALVGFLLAGCTAAAGGDAQPTPQAAAATAIVEDHGHHTAEVSVNSLTVNVELTDAGIKPSTIFIPLGQSVRLVVRNRGASEHHYQVFGLRPADLLWIFRSETEAEVELVMNGVVAPDDHSAHHVENSSVPYRAVSPAGVKPSGSEVHAYAEAGDTDVVLFKATNAGTFAVHCPLHPEMVAEVTVF